MIISFSDVLTIKLPGVWNGVGGQGKLMDTNDD